MCHDIIPGIIISFQRINGGSSFHYWSQCSQQHHSLQQQVFQQAVQPLNTGHLFHQPASKKPNSNKLSRTSYGTVPNHSLCCNFAIHPPFGHFWLAHQLSACCNLYSWVFAECCKADWRCTMHPTFKAFHPPPHTTGTNADTSKYKVDQQFLQPNTSPLLEIQSRKSDKTKCHRQLFC